MPLNDRVAFVTGGGSGLGRGIAKIFAANGASVAIGDVDVGAAQRVAGEITADGGKAVAIPCDVSSAESVLSAVQATVDALGGLDILVNNAGICPMRSFEDITLEEWNRVLAVNLTGAFLCAQAALAHLRQSRCGRVINLGSTAGRVGGIAVGAHYSVSKAGVLCLTKVLAKLLAPYRVTVNSISPGTADTAMTSDWTPEVRESLRKQIPLGRLCQPDDVAAAALFFASDEASFITGATLDVCGGLVML